MSLIPGFPGLLHGGDYNPDQWLNFPGVIDEDFRLMKSSGCNTFSVGIFAWARLEPEEGRYEFAWLDSIMERMAQAGHNVLLATPSGAKPFWLSEKYPEVRRVGRDGLRELSGGRHNHCWTSPVYREKARALNERLAGRYGKHAALKMWHVSNEYGSECFCPLCLGSFHTWLQARYGDLRTVNSAWWTGFWGHEFSDWNQIDPRHGVLDGLLLDWSRFVSWQARDFYLAEAEPLRRLAPGVPVLTNLMGFYLGIDYHALAPHLDIVAEDSYPNYMADSPRLLEEAATISMKFDALRCLKGVPAPWFLMESCIDGRQIWNPGRLKPPGLHHLEMYQALAHGADGTMYFQWRKGRGGLEKDHGAVLGHVRPAETRSFHEVQSLSARYEKMTGLPEAGERAEVALLLDWETRWAYRAARGNPDSQNSEALVAHAAGHYLPLWRRGAAVDVLASTHDFSAYRLVIAPRLYCLLPGVAARLKEFVRAGGTLVMTALSGMVNETNLCWTDGCPGDGLEELTGAWLEEIDVLGADETCPVRLEPGSGFTDIDPWAATRVCARVHERGARVLARYAAGWMEGAPVLTSHAFGAGTTYFMAADLVPNSLTAFYGALLPQLGAKTFYPDGRALPGQVAAVQRRAGNTQHRFLLNFSDGVVEVPLPISNLVDVESGQSWGDAIQLAPWQAAVGAPRG